MDDCSLLNGIRMASKSAQDKNNRFEEGKLYFKLPVNSYLQFFFTMGDFPIQFSIYTSRLWDAQGEIGMYLPPKHPIKAI